MDWKKIFQKVLEYRRIVFEIILGIGLLIAIYSYFTKPVEWKDDKAEILKIEQKRIDYYNDLRDIKRSIDSLHKEQKYTIEKIDGTLVAIKSIEKKRYEKITHYTANSDSSIEFLSKRYKSKLP